MSELKQMFEADQSQHTQHEQGHMDSRERYLPLALRVVALISIFGIYPLTVVWPSGWVWHTRRSEYFEMILAIYATLGVFLWSAARNPGANLSLISFTIWSSIVHGLVMAVQSLLNPADVHHLYGDVLALFVIAGVLAYLCPAAVRPRSSAAGGNHV